MMSDTATLTAGCAVERPWLKTYAHGDRWDIHYEPRPVHTLLDDSAARAPDAPYIDFMGRQYSYGEIAAQVDRCVKGLQTLGVRAGIKVGLFLPNCPQYVIAYYAILKAGGTVVNFSPLYSVPELTHQVEDSETDIMICLDVASLYATIARVLDQSRLRCLVVASLADALPPGKALLYRLFKRREMARVAPDIRHIRFDALLDNDGTFRPVSIDPQDLAMIQYTGGTTGSPKGAELTHANLYTNCLQVAATDPDRAFGADRVLGALPFFHVFANTVVLNLTTCMGGEIVALPKFELNQVLKAITRRRVTIVPGVPTMYTALLGEPQLGRYDLSSIRVCISGGAPMPAELKQRFETVSGSVVVEGYGLTESSGVVAVNPVHGVNKPGSIGLPLPGTDIIIVDRDDPTRIVPQGEPGELCVCGPQIMRGYWRRADASAGALQNGRLHTGDVAYIDSDGYTFIIDRLKDMIMVGGFKVYPRNVEEALYRHPAVKEATVIGIPDAYAGQRVKAFVALKDEARGTTTAEDLLAFLRANVGKHEQPAQIEFRESLPKTMIGKLSKKELVAEEEAKAAQAAQK